MYEEDDKDYNLNEINLEEEEEEETTQKQIIWPKTTKVLLIIFIITCIVLTAVLIFFIILYKKELSDNSKKNSEPSGNIEPYRNWTGNETKNMGLFNFFGLKYPNLTYDDNGTIENTFKKNGDNYNESMGEINNGKDYEKNDRNIYDLYIPQYALDRKNEINGIILWIHGGAWKSGIKEEMDIFCHLYSQQGYISATVEYTLLFGKYKDFNIFRILDEITACIKAIKKYLINLGFSGNKLKLVIGGYSAGGHLALWYSYLIKKVDIIPIEFIINYVGPIGLYPKYFYKLKSNRETLENIEKVEIIEQAIKNGKIISLYDTDLFLLMLMNGFWGNRYTNDDLEKMLDKNKRINEEDEKYKEMLKVAKFGYVTEIKDNNKTPTICIYGGTDDFVGVAQYAYLKQKADKDGRYLDLIYSRYEGHALILPFTKPGALKFLEIHSLTMKYLKKYFGY